MASTSPRSFAGESPEQEQDQEAIQLASSAIIQNQTQQAQTRRKTTGTRVWLVISESGDSHLEEVEKHSIMRWTGLPARDLRVLDPVLSYPSSILGRERAIVVNLEHIKVIITAKEVLMVHSASPLVLQFIQDLHRRIENPQSHFAPHQEPERNDEHKDREDEFENKGHCRQSSQGTDGSVGGMLSIPQKDEGKKRSWSNMLGGGCPKVLPFEFRALEACLESACGCLESETKTLEEEAYPALDELTSKISTLNLERVRQIKSRLVAISGRVQKVRDELEHLLDDDHDMAEMHLTEKLLARSLDPTSIKEEVEKAASDGKHKRFEESAQEECDDSEVNNGFKPSIVELEMLLEAYFAQIDGISHRLSDMNEYVDDTEDCINIMLDDKQNQLLQMGVMLSVANMIVNAGIVVVGLFGMNINITLFDDKPIKFWETTIGTVGGCIVMYLIAVGWGKKRNLLAL